MRSAPTPRPHIAQATRFVTRSRPALVALLAFCVLLISCGDGSEESGPAGLVDRPFLFVGNTSIDFQSGSYAVVDIANASALADLGALHADNDVRWTGGYLFAINRLGGDNIQRIDPGDFATVWQYSTGSGSNPQDILVLGPHKAYVTRYDETSILVVDPEAPDDNAFVTSTLDLAELADADGVPEMSALARIGDRVFVTLQRLDRDDLFAPSNPSYLVAIDPERDQLTDPSSEGTNDFVVLPTANPTSMRRSGTELWIACAGFFGAADGAIVRFDTEAGTFGDPIVTEAALGGDLAAFTATTPAYVLWTDDAYEGHLTAVDPTTGEVIQEVATGIPFVQDLEADEERIYLPDRTPTAAGIRIFRRSDLEELTTDPIGTGLPPWSVEIVAR